MNLQWLVYRARKSLGNRFGFDSKKSYSQCGEDLLVRFIFDVLKIPSPSYLDIGAHHPTYLNNTRIFYETGSRGVNVEPDPKLIEAFRKQRPKDINLNVGVSSTQGVLPFYVMEPPTLNTFSKKDAETAANEGGGKARIKEVVQVPVISITEILEKNFDSPPDFLSLDVEGMDLAILHAWDFDKFRPKVICVETLTYSEKCKGRKIHEIGEWLDQQGYFLYADTYINSIFVDGDIW